MCIIFCCKDGFWSICQAYTQGNLTRSWKRRDHVLGDDLLAGACRCAALPSTAGSLRGGWCEVLYIWWSQRSVPFSASVHLLGMTDVLVGEGVLSFTYAGKEAVWVCTWRSQTSVICRLDAYAVADHCVARRSGLILIRLSFMYFLTMMVMYYYDMFGTFSYFYDIFVRTFLLFLAF